MLTAVMKIGLRLKIACYVGPEDLEVMIYRTELAMNPNKNNPLYLQAHLKMIAL